MKDQQVQPTVSLTPNKFPTVISKYSSWCTITLTFPWSSSVPHISLRFEYFYNPIELISWSGDENQSSIHWYKFTSANKLNEKISRNDACESVFDGRNCFRFFSPPEKCLASVGNFPLLISGCSELFIWRPDILFFLVLEVLSKEPGNTPGRPLALGSMQLNLHWLNYSVFVFWLLYHKGSAVDILMP